VSAAATLDTPLLDEVLAAAKRAGATDADAVLAEWTSASAAVRLGEVETVKLSRERRLGVRCFAGRASAVASTADLDEGSVDRFVRDVADMAALVAPDPDAALPSPGELSPDAPDLGLADRASDSITPEERIERARRCEAAALSVDPRLTNSEGAEFGQSSGRISYASSAGFRGAYETTSYSLSASPVASENGGMQRDSWWDSSRALARLETPETVGRIAAERTLRRLGARKVPTQEVTIVFDPITAASLLRHLAGAVSGGALYRRSSFLLDRLGEEIASRAVTIIDDGRLAGGLASRPFDAEGVATRRTPVVVEGRLESYLLDTYAARRLGLATTGNAARSVGDVPAAAPTNLYLVAGPDSPEDIVASVDRGLYVTSLSGFGVNGVTGDYSRGAAGIWIEKGELTHAVEEVTIAGNLLRMFRDIEQVGSDLVFRASTSAPTVRIRRMTLAGS